jgi:MFS family permease
VGSKKLYLLGAGLGTLVTISLLLAHTPDFMILVMGFAGLFQSLKMTALNASFYSDVKRIGIEKSGWFKGSLSIGLTFIGPVFGGFLIDHFSFSWVFGILAFLTLIPIGLVLVFHEENRREHTDIGLADSLRRQLRDFRSIVGNRELNLPILTESLSTGCFSLFAIFIVVLAVKTLHLPTTVTSTLLTAEGMLFILTVFAAGPLLKIIPQFRMYVLSIGLTIAALFVLASSHSFSAMMSGSLLLGVGTGLLNLITSARLAQFDGDKGKIVALFSAAVGIGISIGPILGGFVATFFGGRAAFLTFVPLFALLLAFARFQRCMIVKGKIKAEHL